MCGWVVGGVWVVVGSRWWVVDGGWWVVGGGGWWVVGDANPREPYPRELSEAKVNQVARYDRFL